MRSTVAALTFIALSAGCGRPSASVTTTDQTAPVAAAKDHALLPPTDVVAGRSIYALDEKLVDHNGQTATLDSFRGHPVIISMFYASCPHACPMLISNVKSIEAKLDPKARADVRVLFVSFDPANDTPAALRAVMERHKLDAARWKLTVASEEQSREIAAVLGIKYRQEDQSFRHSSVITVLDGEGRIVARSDGLVEEHPAMAAKLATLAR